MRIVAYVEGTSDKVSLQTLLAPLIQLKMGSGILIDFFETPEGDRKSSVCTKAPIKAVNILLNNPDSQVITIPDLYPVGRPFAHRTIGELESGIRAVFDDALRRKLAKNPEEIKRRFHVFPMKYDLEALVLAATASLRGRLGVEELVPSWTNPVEDQNEERPPKYVVEELFREYGKRYQPVVDAPMILANESYSVLAATCNQGFGRLVSFLEGLEGV